MEIAPFFANLVAFLDWHHFENSVLAWHMEVLESAFDFASSFEELGQDMVVPWLRYAILCMKPTIAHNSFLCSAIQLPKGQGWCPGLQNFKLRRVLCLVMTNERLQREENVARIVT